MPDNPQEPNKTIDNGKKRPRFLSETILLALLTPYAYILLFSYEGGYCNKFGIPSALIEVSPINVLKTIAWIIPIAWALWALAEVSHIYKLTESFLFINIISTVFVIGLTAFIIYSTGYYKLPFLILMSFLPIFAIYRNLIQPLLVGKEQKTLEMKMRRQWAREKEQEKEKKQEFLMDRTIKKYGPLLFFTILIGYLILANARVVGSYKATTQKSFLVLKGIPEMVVMRTYGQKLICCKFDRKKKEIENTFVIKTMEQISLAYIQIQEEEIGPLKRAKK